MRRRGHLTQDYLDKWIPANKLSKGEHLQDPDGQLATAEGGTTPKDHDGWMWDLTVQDDHDFYVEPSAVLPPSSGGPAAVLVHNCTPEAKAWEPGRPETDNEYQGPLPPDAPMVEPDQALEEGHYHYAVMRGGALRAINSDDMWDLEPSAGHTSLAEGEPVIMAGGFKVDDTGAITEFDNNSGHYMPRDTSGYMPLEEIARAAFAGHGLPAPGAGAWDPVPFW
jgi:hypothetical protein